MIGSSFGVMLADQAVDQHDALAALRLLQRRPPGAGDTRSAAARPSAPIAEVFQERDVVVLTAGGAGHHREGLVLRARLVPISLVLRGQRQPRSARILREGRHGAADTAHEPMHHRSQQRTVVLSRRGAQRQPSQDFSLRDGAAAVLLKGRRQLVERPGRSEFLVQAEDQFVTGQSLVERAGPVSLRHAVAGERPIGRTHGGVRILVIVDREHAAFEYVRGVLPRTAGREAGCRPHLLLVVFSDRLHRVGGHSEEPSRERARRLRALVIDDGRRSRDAGRSIRGCPTEHSQPPDQAGGLRAERTGEGVGLVEHQEVQPRIGEELDVLLPRQQQLELLDVGEQDARLPPRRAHHLPRAHFLGRIHGLAAAVALRPPQARFVVGPRGTGRKPDAGHVGFALGRLADVDPERNTGPGEQPSQAHELVLRQCVHGIDDHRADSGPRPLVPQPQALADDGVEEALGLARARAGGDQRGPSCDDGADRLLLVAAEVRDVLRDPLAQVRMKEPFGYQRLDGAAVAERARQADVRPLEQRRAASLVQRQQIPHLPVQPRIGERVRRELVPQEAAHDVLRVGDRIQSHGVTGQRNLPARPGTASDIQPTIPYSACPML